MIQVMRLRHLRFSLETRTVEEAQLRAHILHQEISTVFAVRRTGMLTDEQVRNLVAAYVQRSLKQDEEKRATGWEMRDTVPNPDEVAEIYRERIGTVLDALVSKKHQRALGGHYADRILRSGGVTEPNDTPGYLLLCRAALKAHLEILETQLARFEGDYQNPYDSQQSYLVAPSVTTAAVSPAPATAPPVAGPCLSMVVTEYINEALSKKKWTVKTKGENQAIFKIFMEYFGADTPITAIDRPKMATFLADLQRLPPNMHNVPKYRGKNIQQVLAMPVQKTLSHKTVNKYLRRICSVFVYALDAGYISRNPASKMEIASEEREDEERDPYSQKDIECIFSRLSKWIRQGQSSQHERFWIPLIALHSGMRQNEICQLSIADIRQEKGVWCFDVNTTTDEKRVKTKAGRRLVPIHSLLIDVGFLNYWQNAKKSSQKQLWPALTYRNGSYGHQFSKDFGTFNRQLVTKERKKVFHSFRHTFINTLKQLEVDDPVICGLVGHGIKGASESMGRYGKAYDIPLRARVVAQLDFHLDVEALKKIAASLHTRRDHSALRRSTPRQERSSPSEMIL
jgi:integrase